MMIDVLFQYFHRLSRKILLSLSLLAIMLSVTRAQPLGTITLREYVETRFLRQPTINGKYPSFAVVCDIDRNPLAARVFREYGAMFAASEEVTPPPKCIFNAAEDVEAFQRTLKIKSSVIAGVNIELQETAMNALLAAIDELWPRRITPLDGAIAGRRTYADTVRIWNSRFIPALNYWVAKGRISRPDANASILMPVADQVAKVVDWESQGMYFGTGRNRSIFYSVAPPGTSQHLSLTALDVVEAGNPRVRSVLNKNGWFQTVNMDEPHFTYLGIPETELPKRGLQRIRRGNHTSWVPLIESSNGQ
jgi:hypothetical protein